MQGKVVKLRVITDRDLEDPMDIAELSAVLRVPKITIRGLIATRIIAGVKVRGRWVVPVRFFQDVCVAVGSHAAFVELEKEGSFVHVDKWPETRKTHKPRLERDVDY